jgi:hypothetical protein
MKYRITGVMSRRDAAFLIGVLFFPVYWILVDAVWKEAPSEYTPWVYKLFQQDNGYVLVVLVALAGAVVLSALIACLPSAEAAAWCLAGFVTANLLRDVEFLVLERRFVDFTVWVPLVGVLAGWSVGRFLKLKRHIADAPAGFVA